ncbi:AAA family ATPase [Streptomyces sp. NPDC090306]|uniref:helix-turn-helix transcriptional regulator n=1 Tax=Streptomyces sp. NPDC090306 TaxID=3365961 RepID=UPI0037F382E5
MSIRSAQDTVETPVLVGRDVEIRRLEQWVDRLAAGNRAGATGATPREPLGEDAHLLMVGDPGVGKSALAAHAAGRARAAGLTVVRLVGLRSECDLAFSVLHQLVDQLAGHLERLSPHQVEVLERALTRRHGERPDRLSVSDAVLDLMRRAARERPFVVLAEDIHWVDVPSAEVLTFLLRRLGDVGPRFLLAARTGRTSPVDTRDALRMNVPALESGAARALLDLRHPGLHEQVRRRVLTEARGNALALVEFPAHLTAAQREGSQELPVCLPFGPGLDDAFAEPVRQLDAAARTALLAVALAGEDVRDLACLRVAMAGAGEPWEEECLTRAADSGLIDLDPLADRLTFRHPLLRAAVLATSPRGWHRAAHARLGRAGVGGPDRRAWHLAQAADHPDETLAGGLAAAAQRMLARGEGAQAAAALWRAAELSGEEAARARRLEGSALAAGRLRLMDTTQRALDRGVPSTPEGRTAAGYVMVHRDGDADGAFRALAPLLSDRVRASSVHEAMPSRLASGDAAVPEPTSREQSPREQPPQERTPLDEPFYLLLDAAAWTDRPALWARLHGWLGHVSPAARICFDAMNNPAAATRDVRLALDRHSASLRPDAPAPEIEGLVRASVALDCFSGHDGAWRTMLGAPFENSPAVLLARCYDAYQRGDWQSAWTSSQSGRLRAEERLDFHNAALFDCVAALVAAGRGDEEAMARSHDRIRAFAAPRQIDLLASAVPETLARAAAGRGDFDEAYVQAVACTAPGRLPLAAPYAQRAFLDLVEAAVRTGRTREARLHLEAGQAAGIDGISVRHRLLLGICSALLADDASADLLYREALGLPGAAQWAWEHARGQLWYGEWLRRRRANTAARPHLTAAAAAYDRLGAARWAGRAREELRLTGVAVSAAERGRTGAITPQELRIAELAAGGLSNKEIARRLNISSHTAAAHLYRVFPKLGVTSRAALRDALRDAGYAVPVPQAP